MGRIRFLWANIAIYFAALFAAVYFSRASGVELHTKTQAAAFLAALICFYVAARIPVTRIIPHRSRQ